MSSWSTSRGKQKKVRVTFVVLVAVTVFALVLSVSSIFFAAREFTVLSVADSFSGPAVGISGEEPETARAFRSLAARPLGGLAFLQLVAFGAREGKIYGLAGLRRTNPHLFRLVVRPFVHSDRPVTTMFGCVVEDVPTSRLIQAENGIRLEPGQTLGDWYEAKRTRDGTQVGPPYPEIDVVGGGYSSMLIDPERIIP